MKDERRHKIIVGVDYGTTYTGASYVSTRGKGIDDIVLIKSWPGPARHSEVVLKSPSRIAYASENGGKHRWGYQVEPGMTAYSWTKLLLDRGTPLTRYDSALEDSARLGIFRLPEDKDAVQVASDFLAGVYEHILKTIAKHITEETLRITPLEFWFTVPAMWSDEAKNTTLEAARRGGFGSRGGSVEDKICLIPEPEAAAIAVIRRSTTDGLGFSVKPGDGILVCDCGGGTVDITTYLVKEVKPTLVFEELCAGVGGKCGSTAIDRKFYHLMRSKFGKSFDNLPRKRTAPGSEFMNKFEIIKRDFGYDSEEITYELPLNMTLADADPKYFNEDERLVMISNDDLGPLFDPVMENILSLVREQIEDANKQAGRKAINRIILVGGFGDSEYLRTAFRNAFSPAGNIAITVPNNAQAAIVQGAALRGLEGLQAQVRCCRRHYGFKKSQRFTNGVDDLDKSVIDKFDGKRLAPGYMKWMVEKGLKYPENYTHEVCIRAVHTRGDDLVFLSTLYTCDAGQAPNRVEHQDVHKVGEITVDFRTTDLSVFRSRMRNGKLRYELKYSLKVIFVVQEGVLRFEACTNGRVIGKTSIEFAREIYY
ncbi:hypothetical protein BJX99DRAFT_266451 [Aspergillus californicus]